MACGTTSLCLVLVVAADPVLHRAVASTGWLLPVLLSTPGGEIEPVVGADEQVSAAGVRGVRVEDPLVVAEEGAGARLLTGASAPVHVLGFEQSSRIMTLGGL